MKRILSLILCLSVLLSASVFSLVASADDVAPEEPAWTEYVPTAISDAIQIGGIKGFGYMGYANAEGSVFTNVKATEDTSATYPLTNGLVSWLGEITISSKDGTLTGSAAGKPVELFRMPYVQMGAGAGNSIMFYIEIPDYEKSGATWAVGLSQMNYIQNSTTFPSNISWDGITFSYLPINGSAWVTSDVVPIGKSEGNFAQLTLPSGFKGYIRLGPETIPVWGQGGVEFDKTQPYTFNLIELALNSIGGECGDFVCGGIAYTTNNVTDSIYMTSGGKYSKLTKSDTILAKSYAGYNESNSSNSTADITLTGGSSAAIWDLGSAIFTSNTDTAQTAIQRYTRDWPHVKMQPGVDTFMFYVEVPEFEGTGTPLYLDWPEMRQNEVSYFINPSNAKYKYMSVEDGIWKTATATYTTAPGSDAAALSAIKSGFKGYIKIDLKEFDAAPHNGFSKKIEDGFDPTKPYDVEQFRIFYNYAGGEDNPFVFGSLYSVFADADSYIFTNSVVGNTVCAKEITGDLSGDGSVDATDLATGRRILLGISIYDAYRANRAELNTDDAVFNIRDLVALKKLIAAIAQ